ncbi:MAG: N-acetylmuramoyl-L-alanine amidase [Chitinophagaceae bacterium]|nr:N-acetylmuramoyl-L-alanine amidase [Chitinophagaceae bacterium]
MALMKSIPTILLVSIHVNASISLHPKHEGSKIKGFEVYVKETTTSKQSRSLCSQQPDK